jgi:hypothetical protein
MDRHESQARARRNDELGDAARDEIQSDLAAATNLHNLIQERRRRRHEKVLSGMAEEINMTWEEEQGASGENITCPPRLESGYKRSKEVKCELQSDAPMGPQWDGQSSPIPQPRAESCWFQAANSRPRHINIADRVTHQSDRAWRRSQPQIPVERMAPASWNHVIMRARGSKSDNSFLLKRKSDYKKVVRRQRTASEPRSYSFHNVRSGNTTRGSEKTLTRRNSGVQIRLPSTNGNTRAQDINPPSKTISTVQDGEPLPKKGPRSITYYPGQRSSLRLLQLRNKESVMKKSKFSLPNLSSRKRKHSSEVGRAGKKLSWQLRSSTRRPTEIEKHGQASQSKSASRLETRGVIDENTVVDLAREQRTVTIPADADLATDLRRYCQWPGRYQR